jgi:hypothetical protein
MVVKVIVTYRFTTPPLWMEVVVGRYDIGNISDQILNTRIYKLNEVIKYESMGEHARTWPRTNEARSNAKISYTAYILPTIKICFIIDTRC